MLKKTIISLFVTLVAAGSAGAQSVLNLSESFLEESVVLPESFETDVNKMMQNWYLNNYVVADGVTTYSPDIAATDQQVIERLAKLPTEIEMPYNTIVRSIINAYTQRRRALVQNLLGLSLYYMPIFEEALEREGLPMELRYLPVIESALNPDAVSRVGATGLWQFMAKTAKGLGMEVNSVVDERRDPYKSSEMAAKYLKELYNTFGDWSLAIAAYNCGPGNVNKALRRAGGGKHDFWDIYPYLLQETRNYFPGFIAANYVMNYYNEHGIAPALARRPIVTDSVHVKKRVYFQQIADVLKIPVSEIRILNPQYRKDYIPGDIKPYPLVLPSYQIYSYIMSEDSILAHNASTYARRTVVEPSSSVSSSRQDGDYVVTETIKYHKVKKGESLGKIAKKYGVSLATLQKANGKVKTLRIGQTIKVPVTERVYRPRQPEPEPEPEVAPKPEDVIELTAGEQITADNDSLALSEPDIDGTDIPEMGNADADEESLIDFSLDSAAEEDDDDIAALKPEEETVEPGEPAKVTDVPAPTPRPDAAPQPAVPAPQPKEQTAPPKPAPQPAATASKPAASKPAAKSQAPVYHTVVKGDSPAKIAKKYGTTTEKILKLNNLKRSSKIHPGQKIRVK